MTSGVSGPDELQLKVNLDVLASTCIKRKKPWPKLALVGESIFLLDHQRVSVLYMGTGKTKKKIPKLHGVASEAILLTHSSDGAFIGGLLSDGNLFLWHKNSDTLKYITGLSALATSTTSLPACQSLPYMCIADNGFAILLVNSNFEMFVWEIDDLDTLLVASQGSRVQGSWSYVEPGKNGQLPKPGSVETAVNATFTFTNAMLGRICICSFVFANGQDMNVSTVLLRWFEDQDTFSVGHPKFTAEWQLTAFPVSAVSSHAQPVCEAGALVARHTHDGQLLAIAVNQLSTHCNKLVFVSPLPGVITISDLYGMGARFPLTQHSRTYWIADMEWLCDDLFLACITGQGSVFLVPRLGEPILIQTFGRGIDMGPKYFLPLHPLVTVQGNAVPDSDDPMRQRFSVAVHPSLQLVLFSDGYMVTAVELSDCGTAFSCLSLMRLLSDAAHARLKCGRDLLDWLRSTKLHYSASDLADCAKRRRMGQNVDQNKRPVYRFEATPANAYDETVEPDYFSTGGKVLVANSGRLIFGDSDNMMTTREFLGLNATPGDDKRYNYIDVSAKQLMFAWGLITTHAGVWTVNHETEARNIVYGFMRLFSAMLSSEENDSLQRVLQFFKRMLEMSSCDGLGQHLIVVSLMFVRNTVELLLRAKSLRKISSFGVLLGASLIIRYAEQHFARTYGVKLSPHSLRVNAVLYDSLDRLAKNTYSFQVSVNAITQQQVLDGKLRRGLSFTRSVTRQNSSLVQRLFSCWQLLHRYALRYYESMTRHDSEAAAAAVAHQKRKRVSYNKLQNTVSLLSAISDRLQCLNVTLADDLQRTAHSTRGDALYLDGSSELAIGAWLNYLQNITDDEANSAIVCRVLHSILYTQLLSYRLRDAVYLVELTLRLTDVRKVAAVLANARLSPLPPMLQSMSSKDKSAAGRPVTVCGTKYAEKLIQTIGRIIATYFTKSAVFVFPPHHPLPIPALWCSYQTRSHELLLNRDRMIEAIRFDQLGAVWTAERALEYLLVGGLLADAVWFIGQLGDWKGQLTVAATVQWHLEELDENHDLKRKLHLPDHLQPASLAQQHILPQIKQSLEAEPVDSKAVDEVTSLVFDRILISLLCGHDTTTLLLRQLLDRLLNAVKQFQCLVPDDVYLPAPPIYCPQPVITEEERKSLSPMHLAEVECRQEVALLIRNLMIVFRASRSVVPAISWFSKKVLSAYRKARKLQKDASISQVNRHIKLMEPYTSVKSIFVDSESDVDSATVLSTFRDLCCVIWMLHNRDELSQAMRKKASHLHLHLNRIDQLNPDKWTAVCDTALTSCVRLLPFAEFMRAEHQLQSSALSLLAELPRTADTALKLARLFPDSESVSPQTQEKLRQILKDWQSVFVEDELDGSANSARGKTLAVLYHELSRQYPDLLERKQKAFGIYDEEVVFSTESFGTSPDLTIGSRPCESTGEFMEFLDIFFSVSFVNDMTLQNRRQDLPLLNLYVKDIRNCELNSKSLPAPKLRRNISINMNSDAVQPAVKRRVVFETPVLRQSKPVSARASGLFRSRSVDCMTENAADSPAVSRRNSLQPREVDVLAADADGGNVVRESKPVVASLMNTNNNNSGVNRQRYVPVRSVSLIEHNDVSDMSERSNSLPGFAELESVLSGLNVKNWMFPSRWLASEKIAEWFSSQTAHKLAEKSSAAGAMSAIRVRVSPKMLAYALWLQENSSFVVPPKVEDVVVAVVGQSTGNMPPPQPSRSNPIPTPSAALDIGSVEQTRKGRLRRQKKDSGTHNRSQIPEEPEESEEYDANQWGTKRLAFTAATAEEPHDNRVARANTNKNESVNSSECSVSVSSQLDDDDVGQLQQAMHETLARISRPGTTHLEDTDGNGRFMAAVADTRPAAAKQDSAINTTLPVATQSKPLEDPRPSGNDLVSQLQKAVRDEMRRIMQVQQQGILAVLNVLDDHNEETAAPPVRRVDNKTSSDRFQQRQESSASVNNNSSNNKPETTSHLVEDEHTDVSVSLLTSEEDQPAPAPLASKQPPPPPPSKPAASGTVLTALNELKNLQSIGNRQLRLLRLNRTAGADKENRPYDSNRPFTSLIDALKQMNDELGANKKGDSSSGASQLRLLRMFPQTDLDSAPVRLPRVTPTQMSGPPVHPSLNRMNTAGISMPLIANGMPRGVVPTDRAFTGYGMLRFPPPAAGNVTGLHAGSSDDLPFPMLRLTDGNTQQVPFFVPPVHIPSFQRNQQPENHAGQRLFTSPPLLTLDEQRDLPSPTPSDDTVTNEKTRRSRRPRRAPSQEKGDEVENTVSDESLDLPKPQPAAMKKHQQTSSSPVRTVTNKTEPNQRDDGTTKLHSGFALTPGMFDEYLLEQPANGSDMVSSAQLHYQAVQAVQAPKQRAVLKKDMSTDTNEQQPAVGAFSAGNVGQTLSVGSLLPPDVYMQLQLPVEPSRQNSVTPGARTFLNVADINADVLSDLVFKQPTSQAPARADAKVPNLEPNLEESNLFGDEVTLSVLKSGREPHSIGGPLAVRAGLSARSPYSKSKDKGKLMMDNMNSQLAAITAMAQHMDNDFRNTRLLMTAVDEVGDDVIPRPQTARAAPAAAAGKPFNINDSQRPVNVQRSPGRVATAWLDNDEEKENQARDDDASAEPGMYSLPTAEEDLNTDQWPHGLAARMLEQAMRATDDGVQLSRSDLKELFRVLSPPTTSRYATAERTAADADLEAERRKREVREWMLKKREERMSKFQAENEERRAAEKHPYKPPSSGSKTKRDLEEAEKDRMARKRAMHDLRSQDASRLTYELLSDEIPIRPSSPVHVTASKPETHRRPKSSPTRQKATLTKAESDAKAWLDRADEATRIYQDIYDNYSRLLVNGYHDDGDFQTTNADDRKTSRPATDRQEKKSQSGVPTTQSKPFTDLVRLRRPDVLADNRNRTAEMIRRKPPPNTSADPTKPSARSENQTMQQNATSSRSMKFNDSSRPRVVKTYAERLQEMKQTRPSSVQSSRSLRPSPKYTSKQPPAAGPTMQAAQKPRKTLTYAEQLKSLQLPKEQYYQKSARSEDGRAISRAGQQRQIPQQRSKGAPSTSGQRMSHEYAKSRSSLRSRPYANPYSESFDDASNLSSWSMDDNVRRLIYGNSVSDKNTINSTGSMLDVSDLPVDNPYVDTVDVDDLESVVSGMSKVSWSSFLDWSEVDKLVEGNH